ncbi:TonB-dependent receptor [Arcticibacter tournemirensis]|uniref:TonB-dependent receptor n=2 Tax=Arcticibacter tournemirensis TaxID=699437 RepID=A0A4Q0M9W7_9SPHI|nr:TonB-dependent receptor [Arcticibacter tournemirensis]
MYKKYSARLCGTGTYCLKKYLIIMKFTAILLVVSIVQTTAASFAQKVSINVNNAQVKDVLYELTKKTGYSFIADAALLEKLKPVTLRVKNEPLRNVLERCFDSEKFEFLFNESESVVIKSKTGTAALMQVRIRGKVTDEQGEPLPGASVTIKGGARGTSTDLNGNFILTNVSSDAVLVVSFIGMQKQEIPVNGRTEIKVVLKNQSFSVEEVVIVGYGQQKKESVTGAISTIGTKDLVQSPVANISNALAGRLSGLTAIQTSGKPGDDKSTLYIRGIGTYTDQTSPLIMIDGVARTTYNEIDPNEIESISMLKDASATAVYGVRGANGVILITTKRGQEGAPKIAVSSQTAVSEFTREPKFVNSYEYATLQNEKSFQLYWINHAKDADVKTWNDFLKKRESNWTKEATLYYTPEQLLYYKNAHTPTLENGERNPYYSPYFYPDVNWTDQMFKNFAPQSQVNANISGGTEALKYFVSLGYLTQGGLFKTDYMKFSDEMDFRKKRYNVRGNFDFDVNKNFRISVDVGTQFVNISGMDNDNFIWEKRILWSNPMSSPGIIDGKFVVPYSNPQASLNPLYEIANSNNYNLTDNSTLNSTIKLSHKLDFITNGLSVNAKGAYDSYFSSRSGGKFSPVYYGISPNPNGDVLDPIFSQLKEETPPERWSPWHNGKWRKIYGEFSLNYNRSFGDHAVSGLVLYNLERFYDPNLAYHLPKSYTGLATRFTYGYRSRYLAEFNMGYNGSENFPEGKRFGLLPAYSLGWVASNESFFPKNDLVSYLKVRGSVGKVGNDNIGGARYLYLPDVWTYGGSGYPYMDYAFGTIGDRNNVQGSQEGTLGNPNVTWETATKANIGFEAHFFRDKLSITYDHFSEKRVDILSYRGTVPAIVQASLPPYNLGEVKNWGNELEINFRTRAGKFDYWVKANIANNRNKIIFRDEAISDGLEYQATTGRPIGQGLYLQADGLYTSWADLYNIDTNGDPVLAEPVRALNQDGQPYTNAQGAPVYQKDLGYGGVAIQPGEVRLKDVNEDGVVNEKDLVRTGNTTIPKITYGISFGFNWKGFDFSTLLQGVGGVAKFAMSQRHFNKQESLFEVDLNRFTLERYNNGEKIDFPLAAYDHTGANNTYFLKNTSYMRLKNLEIGYTVKPEFLKRVGIRSARVYANGNNLTTWSPNEIWGDPENLAYIGYPLTRTYNLGLNINF